MRYCYPSPDYHEGVQDFDNLCHKIPTDHYYADLTGDWDSDGDGYFGEFGQDSVDLNPEVLVGRIPFDDSTTISTVLQRIINFSQDSGSWKKKALLLGAISNYQNENNEGWSKTDGAVLMEKMWSDFLQANGFQRTTMYEKEGIAPSTYACDYPLNQANVVSRWKNDGGYGIVVWHAHGWMTSASREVWSQDKNGDGIPQRDDNNPTVNEMDWYPIISSSDASNLDSNHPSIVYSASCLNSYPEYSNNLSSNLLQYACSSVVGSTRESWYAIGWSSPNSASNQTLEYYTLQYFTSNNFPLGDSLFKAKLDTYNFNGWGWEGLANMYDFNLYGDPSLTSPSPADFSISATPSSQTVIQGSSTTYTVNLTSINGFNYSVSLSVTSSLPSGVTYSFSPTSVTPTGSSTLTITTSSSTPANTYTITIQGTGGGKTHTYDVALVVQPNAPTLHHFEFSPISSPQTANVPFTITITAKDQYGNTYTGFNSSVTLSVNKGSITPTTTTNFVNGVLSNFSVTIPTANTGVTITATSQDGKTGTSNAFDVTTSPINTLTLHLSGNKFNFVSFPFEVTSSLIPNFVQAYSFDWSNYWATPTTFEPGKGYWIKVTQDEDVTLTGTPVSSPVSVTVTPGKFNLLGNPFNTPISLSDLNSKNGNHILKVYTFDWSHYWTLITPDKFSTTTLEPGRAYWIQLDNNASNTFTFSLP
jgi:hypothetical protein